MKSAAISRTSAQAPASLAKVERRPATRWPEPGHGDPPCR
jgi:hypothetical protein